MGKTSTALAVMAHADLKKQFPGRNLVWVPCVKATSVALFLDTLHTAVAAGQSSGNTLSDILSELESSGPLLLLLDNFETPWNVSGGRAETEQILCDIERILHITVFVTM